MTNNHLNPRQFGGKARRALLAGLATFALWCAQAADRQLPGIAGIRAKAEAGDAVSQRQMGDAHYRKQQYATALRWYLKAARQGDLRSVEEAATIYMNGGPGFKEERVEKDIPAGILWTRRAAAAGSAKAQRNLGLYHRSGVGVAKDTLEAYKWLRIGSRKDVQAKMYLDQLMFGMTTSEVEAGEKRVQAFQTGSLQTDASYVLPHLKLEAITGSADRRVASINGEVFEEGETRSLKVGVESVEIQCIAVGERTAKVRIVGTRLETELRLGATQGPQPGK